ncbi:hypothetical protein C0J45_15278, partial [Silurus meridionalis]
IFTMISSLEHTTLIAAVSFLNIELYFCACGRAEYEINGECCPMCPPGNQVYRHCTEFTSTTCMPCVGSTYTDEPNGLSNCLSCTVCDVGQGLKVKMACTWTSDTVCEPLEGFYCTDNYRDKCIFARQHTQCNPGEYIKQEAEYEINGECCPMCPPGNRVYRHCTEFTSTTCMPCVGSTYTDEPNGLSSCLSCTVCDVGQGLKVKNACTWTSDTVCKPLEGFYCTDNYSDKCTFALQHTKCNPGEFIKKEGTAVKDTECAGCADGTYSNGSLHICKQHTKCEDLGHEEITPGNNSVDAQCGVKTPTGYIIVGVTAVLAVVLAVGVALFFKQRKKKGRHIG